MQNTKETNNTINNSNCLHIPLDLLSDEYGNSIEIFIANNEEVYSEIICSLIRNGFGLNINNVDNDLIYIKANK